MVKMGQHQRQRSVKCHWSGGVLPDAAVDIELVHIPRREFFIGCKWACTLIRSGRQALVRKDEV